ncbi:hypothetical protein [Bacillus benzoevorans]|uniref:F0F1-type ATP synthase gamma subunit n=1 Tax=Bacillus benzoevorans TaxID=1456 RepID=A0A7X0LVZ8_9BACI|nr:hypothetical protein [Bacillus benzoevorans]MBB6446050.1 F0F1-type ATP synthase gamma subunit [Bacillus benzoevorans]
MSYKQFAITVLTLVLLAAGGSASFIYYIDPMWTFGHSHEYNDVQYVIDERQQKVNAMHFQPFDYDTLLIGSSRTTYINQHDFTGMKVYNFSASNVSIREYEPFLQYAVEQNGKSFERVIIGLDFFKTSINQSSGVVNLDSYIAKMEEPFYRYKNLLSYDLLKYAYDNFKMSKADANILDRSYNRSNVAQAMKIDSETTSQQTKEKIKKFRKEFYGETYQYNPEYKAVLQQLIDKYPQTEFIFYTTPISTPLFTALVDQGLLPSYEQWITDVTAAAGGMYNFMYPNSITNDIGHYFDGHHFYPEVGTMIAHRIDGTNQGVPADFGTYVTPENLADQLEFVRKESEGL